MYRLCLLIFILFTTSSFAGPKVLLLNSYHAQYSWTRENNLGIQQVLKHAVADQDLYIEFMDSRRFIDDPKHLQALLNLYRHKYRLNKPDLIISTDDFALDFLIQYGAQLFPNVPVIFNGVNFYSNKKLAGLKNFIGIQEGEAIEENLKLITQLHSGKIDEIFALSDKSSLGILFSEKILAIQNNWNHPDIKLTLKDDFSFEELLYQVNNFSLGKAYFISALHKDNQERYFSYSHDIPILTRYSKAPIYGMWGTPLMGLGVVGGYMNNPRLHGKNTAQLALDILSGKIIDNINKSFKAQFLPRFDNRQLEKFNIDLEDLPQNSEINFQPQTLFSRFKDIIISILIIIVILIVIIALLSVQVRRRRHAEYQLALLNNDLEDKIIQRTLALESSNRALLKLNSRMESLANTDDLTLIPNRRHGHRILDRLSYYDGDEYCIALIDIDHFKNVNDNHGHDCGDQVLQFISHTISQLIRPSDTICRWGGEEFLLIMPATQLDNALLTSERIRHVVATTPVDPIETITLSAGIASSLQAKTISELLRQADLALYQAKEQGRNRCIIWKPDLDQLKRPIN